MRPEAQATSGPVRPLTSWAGAALGIAAVVLAAAACGVSTPLAEARTHASGPHAASPSTRRPAGTTTSTTATSVPRSTTTTSTTATSVPRSTTTTSTTATSVPRSTTATSPPATSVAVGKHGPVTEPPLPAPGRGFVADTVTAVGDSVMIDYEGALAQDIPRVRVTAVVSRWWTTGETVLRQLKSQDALGAVVIVGLGTNGPVSAAQFDSMMSVLTGASRVVFVNNRVDRTWQDSNNAVLAQGVARYPRAVLVNWYALAVQHPSWLYATQTHLPIDGPGARTLAALVAAAA
jgi:hypothetical protein